MRISVCHCLDCQRRSGSAFTAQARWPEQQVVLTGERKEWCTVGESGYCGRFFFCSECGATVVYQVDSMPGVTAVAIGAFANPSFPPPRHSMWEERKHPWVEITGPVEHVF